MNNFVLMIDHDGVIESIEGELAHVKIISESACASCHAKGVCGAADQEEKYLDVPLGSQEFKAGEKVSVLVARNLGFKAVGLGYVYPLVLLMAILITLITMGMDEMKAALLALLSLPPYYLAIYLSRKRINKTFTFSIKKIPLLQ
jgi:sigma-E factor negative regulatory protein RseC